MPDNSAYHDEIELLKRRVTMLEQGLARLSPADKKPVSTIKTQKQPRVKKKSKFIERLTASASGDIELVFGGNIIGKLGLITIILATAWFLKFSIQKNWINESVRIVLGLMAGYSIILYSVSLFKSQLRVMPPALLGAGFGIVYLASFAAYHYYALITRSETFLALFLLSMLMTWLAYLVRNQAIYIFSLMGAFIAPLLLSTGENSYRFLFSYITVLNLTYLWITSRNSWRVAPFIVVTMNVLIYSVWAASNLENSSFIIQLLYLLTAAFIFLYREIIFAPLNRETVIRSSLLLIGFIFSFTSMSGYILFKEYYPKVTAHFLLFIGGASLSFEIFFNKRLRHCTKQIVDKNLMRGVLLASCLALIYSSLTDFAEGNWLSLAYIAFSAMITLVVLQSHSKSTSFGHITALCIWFIALIRLYFFSDTPSQLMFNWRFSLYLLTSGTLFTLYFIASSSDIERWLKRVYIFAAVTTIIIGSLAEMHDFITNAHYRNLSYSFVLATYAAIFISIGFIRKLKPIRIVGISLFVLVAAKLYLYDIWTLNLIARIIGGFILGAVLVTTSIVYQKKSGDKAKKS